MNTQLIVVALACFVAGLVLGLLALVPLMRHRGRMVGLLSTMADGSISFYRSADVVIPAGDHVVYILPQAP